MWPCGRAPPAGFTAGRPARVARAAAGSRAARRAAAMSRKRLQQLVDSLGRSPKHFNEGEVECLIKLFDTLVAGSSSHFAAAGLDRNMFRDILHRTFGMTDDMIMDRVFRTFDRDNDSCISVVEWVEGLSIFLRGTLEERIKYCFEVYDLNGDGYISREEMFQMLKNSLLKQPSEEDPDEGIKDLVDIAMKKMDYDHDGRLSFVDFKKAVRDENLLLEAFGPCLPDIKVVWLCYSLAFPQVFLEQNLLPKLGKKVILVNGAVSVQLSEASSSPSRSQTQASYSKQNTN
ncbi:calaxin isoform X4 [Colius striatus]|uniref:calaxin isoform X4 n=1 Tax=Colius striatus TaxID=57412 RepID=UPI002B1DEA83|nr:calaxin isoform X4 [Colius striatus]